jgi:hypothetical protein
MRSQVAVVTENGQVQLNKNTVNGTEPILRLIGDLPAGTPVAFEAAFGWGWLVQLLEDYGFDPHLVHPLRCKAIASARLKNDKVRRRDVGPESFSAQILAPADTLRVGVAGLGAVQTPVRGPLAKKLIAVGRPAKFGRAEQTLTDTSVRDTWEITPGLVTLDGPAWEATAGVVLDDVRDELGLPPTTTLRAELHAMLIYGKGQFLGRQP